MSHAISQSMLPEFDHEFANTLKTLERVPEDKPDFKPHDKSMPMANLAGHLAEIPVWATMTLKQDVLDMNPADGSYKYSPLIMTSRAELIEAFTAGVKQAREALAATSDEEMMKPWTLRSGDQEILTMPRVAVMRSFIMNHMVHHRAQLGVYLRMNDVPVPGLYGPSADEAG
jgi:uncharacterized damage-inducible protein DinB